MKLLPNTIQWRVGRTKLDIYVFITITTSTDELLGIILPESSASVVAYSNFKFKVHICIMQFFDCVTSKDY